MAADDGWNLGDETARELHTDLPERCSRCAEYVDPWHARSHMCGLRALAVPRHRWRDGYQAPPVPADPIERLRHRILWPDATTNTGKDREHE